MTRRPSRPLDPAEFALIRYRGQRPSQFSASTIRGDYTALLAEAGRLRAELAATNARVTAVLELTTASREELEQMDPEQYHQAVGYDSAVTDIQLMLTAPAAPTAQEA